MEETSKSRANDGIHVSLLDFLADSEDEGDISIREEVIEELMQELYKEISLSKSPPLTILSTAIHPMPLSSPQFVADNGKSESCGASLSGTESTVMAGVECVVPVVRKDGEACYGFRGEKMDGCDGVESGDEWLTRVLSWGPLEMEDWT